MVTPTMVVLLMEPVVGIEVWSHSVMMNTNSMRILLFVEFPMVLVDNWPVDNTKHISSIESKYERNLKARYWNWLDYQPIGRGFGCIDWCHRFVLVQLNMKWRLDYWLIELFRQQSIFRIACVSLQKVRHLNSVKGIPSNWHSNEVRDFSLFEEKYKPFPFGVSVCRALTSSAHLSGESMPLLWSYEMPVLWTSWTTPLGSITNFNGIFDSYRWVEYEFDSLYWPLEPNPFKLTFSFWPGVIYLV